MKSPRKRGHAVGVADLFHKASQRNKIRLVSDPLESAQQARLRYVGDDRPGIVRKRNGKHFRYFLPDGRPVRDAEELRRIRALAIPPAWTDVWICPLANGHLQATGRDDKGRKQYRYHPRWRTVRDETKYDRILAFGRALPSIRARVEQDLARIAHRVFAK
jgi:DNA topoisomerase-1